MDKIYHAYYSINTGSYNGHYEVNIKYWRNESNAWNAIANDIIKRFEKNDNVPQIKYLLKDRKYVEQDESYNFELLIEDIKQGRIYGVTLDKHDYRFIVKEVKTED